MDIKSAFLYGTIEEEVYVTQPPGFKDPDHPDKVYKMIKALYGLHQAPRAWDSPFELVAHTDSDYAGAPLDRKSTTGGCQFLGNRLISWQCKKQTVVATSTTKAEYVAATSCCGQVGDEAVHKELSDRMERDTTTASSLEAEQDSVSQEPSCLLGDVNAQTRFEITSKQSIDPPLSRGYTLGSGEDSMKLIGIDEILQLPSSSMSSLIICLATNQKFNLSKYIFDAMVKHLYGGVKFLLYPRFLQVFINQQLGNMSTHKKIFVNPFHTKKVFANMKRAGKDFTRRITPLFDTMMVQPVEEMGEDSDHPTDSTPIHIIDQPSSSSQPKKDKPSTKAQRHEAKVPQDEAEVLDLQKAKDAQAKEIVALKKRIQRLERRKMSRPTGLKRLSKVGMSRRVRSYEDEESLGAPEDASKQGRILEDDVMHVEAKVDGKDKQSKKPDDSTTGEAVTTASINDRARGSEFHKRHNPSSSKVKGKKYYDWPEVPLKRKYQIALDEQIARDIQAKLDAELLEEQKLVRKQEEEANMALIESWENTQAMIEL
ncbi:putative ribonuclease H-like domain-containing protein [Tanacetum coccineum]